MAFPSSMRSMIEIRRGLTSTLLFGLFGLGALLISPLVVLLRRPERGMFVVRFCWRPLVWLFVATGLIRLETENLPPVRGTVLAANHPSFIDVVLLTVLFPKTLYVAKHALLHNPFMATIVRSTALPDDARLLGRAKAFLARGWNVLIFPEGTRSPSTGMRPFRRGAAQLALRTRAPLVAIGIRPSRRILGKDQRPWEMGDRTVVYRFRTDKPVWARAAEGETIPIAARRLTMELKNRIEGLCA